LASGVTTIYFEGKPVSVREGDTIASALFRSGRRIFTRSFKYHRPRGLLCLAGKCPNCMVNVDGTPTFARVPCQYGTACRVRSQNAWPSLESDYLSVAQKFDWLMPVGWYYKTMTSPRAWHLAEPYIRKVAGLGDPPEVATHYPEYEHAHMQPDVAIVGGGPSGLREAIERGQAGEEVLLIDDQPSPEGICGTSATGVKPSKSWSTLTSARQTFKCFGRSYCFGLYEGNLLGIVQTQPHGGAAERLVHVRAKHVVIATGAYEAPLPFENNDSARRHAFQRGRAADSHAR
jgi:sarcosine oxidase subunit alpha